MFLKLPSFFKLSLVEVLAPKCITFAQELKELSEKCFLIDILHHVFLFVKPLLSLNLKVMSSDLARVVPCPQGGDTVTLAHHILEAPVNDKVEEVILRDIVNSEVLEVYVSYFGYYLGLVGHINSREVSLTFGVLKRRVEVQVINSIFP